MIFQVIATVQHKFAAPEYKDYSSSIKMGKFNMYGCVIDPSDDLKILYLAKISHVIKSISMDEFGTVEIELDIFDNDLGNFLLKSFQDKMTLTTMIPALVMNGETLVTVHYKVVEVNPADIPFS